MLCDEFVPDSSVQVVEKVILNFKPRCALWPAGHVACFASEYFTSPVVQAMDVILVVEVKFQAILWMFTGPPISLVLEYMSLVFAVMNVFDKHLGMIRHSF